MAYEPKDNTGSLFKNDKREKDTHPHARGSALIDGVEYWMDAWTNEDRNGNKYQSVKFKPKDQQQAPRGGSGGGGWGTEKPGSSNYDDLDDSVPFITSDSII